MLWARVGRIFASVIIVSMFAACWGPTRAQIEANVEARNAEEVASAKQALARAEQELGRDHPDTLLHVNDLAELYRTRGRYDEAELLHKRALEAYERVLGDDHPDTLRSVNNLALLFRNRGRYAEAEPLYIRALEGRERVLGREHPATLNSVSNLAALYHAQGRYGEAEPLKKRALEVRERVLGREHPDTLLSVNNLAVLYDVTGRYDEAEPLFVQAIEAYERVLGRDHPETIRSINNLAMLYQTLSRYGEAEPLHKRAREAYERTLGRLHPDTLRSVNHLAGLYLAQGRYGEAEPLFRRALDNRERVLGPEHPETLLSVNNLAELYRNQGRYGEAEPLYARALESLERMLGRDHPDTLLTVNNQALLYLHQGRYEEAEPLYKRALEAYERLFGKEHPDTLRGVNNLALLYRNQSRYPEAEALYKRAFESYQQALGQEHPDALLSLNNLAELYRSQGHYDQAEPLHKQALGAYERALGLGHPDTLRAVNNLGLVYFNQGRYGEAEPLYVRALASYERALGPEHPDTLNSVENLGVLYRYQERYGEAEPLLRRALASNERTLGPEHPDTLLSLHNLAALYLAQSDWTRAASFWQRSTASLAKRSLRNALDPGKILTGAKKSEVEQYSWQFQALVKAVNHLAGEGRQPGAEASRTMFETAQWALGSNAAQSLALMTARGAKGNPELAALVRERQDSVAEWQRRDALRNGWLAEAADKRNANAEAENAARIAAVGARVLELDKRLAASYPDYAALISLEPLSIEAVQTLLSVDEALVLYLDTGKLKPTPEETFIWVVTKTEARWVRSDLGTAALTREVQALRCGLDEEEWATPTKAQRCGDLLSLTQAPDTSRPLPFNLGKAHALYQALFGQIEDLVAGKKLLIVPSGPLTSLPFHVLVTKDPQFALPEHFEGYRGIAWLARSNAITTLPAVSSLTALRRHGPNRLVASDAYAGYGNPLLNGDGSSCRVAKTPAACPGTEVGIEHAAAGVAERATVRGRSGRRSGDANTDEVFAKGSTPEALLAQVRGLCPLPDTAYEITCVAERFGAKAPLIRLAGEAKEGDIKAMSESGQLARYRVLHFATHGLVSGDVERMANRQGEPALVLTPPDKPADAQDDGLLMASEIAALKLNADWVVMSACNTAAGDKIGAQALSGLARAFFYAGGRTLLVSHWPVYSDAAVRLTTSAFAELDRNPKAGRGEALQYAMNALMDDRSQADNAHPAVWAPFVVVGEGGR